MVNTSVIAKYRPTHTAYTRSPLVLASHKVAVRHARTDSANPPFPTSPPLHVTREADTQLDHIALIMTAARAEHDPFQSL